MEIGLCAQAKGNLPVTIPEWLEVPFELDAEPGSYTIPVVVMVRVDPKPEPHESVEHPVRLPDLGQVYALLDVPVHPQAVEVAVPCSLDSCDLPPRTRGVADWLKCARRYH